MPQYDDTINAMAGAITAIMSMGHEEVFINAMMKAILTVLAMADTKPETVKEMFTHFYREYCKGLVDNDV